MCDEMIDGLVERFGGCVDRGSFLFVLFACVAAAGVLKSQLLELPSPKRRFLFAHP